MKRIAKLEPRLAEIAESLRLGRVPAGLSDLTAEELQELETYFTGSAKQHLAEADMLEAELRRREPRLH